MMLKDQVNKVKELYGKIIFYIISKIFRMEVKLKWLRKDIK